MLIVRHTRCWGRRRSQTLKSRPPVQLERDNISLHSLAGFGCHLRYWVWILAVRPSIIEGRCLQLTSCTAPCLLLSAPRLTQGVEPECANPLRNSPCSSSTHTIRTHTTPLSTSSSSRWDDDKSRRYLIVLVGLTSFEETRGSTKMVCVAYQGVSDRILSR